jgi:hypothetical protein
MSAPVAFCPQCHNEVAFIHEGRERRCPVCGFTFQTGVGAASRYSLPATGNGSASGVRIFLIFFLILIAIAVIGLGVVYVGCAVMLKGI